VSLSAASMARVAASKGLTIPAKLDWGEIDDISPE
jgi:hypothetical protein